MMKALAGSRAELKAYVSSQSTIQPDMLPIHEDFLAYLRRERAMGTKLVLATAAHEKVAEAFCDHIGLFESYVASNSETNLKGTEKLEKIKEISSQFHYAGNSEVDLAIWKEAKGAVVVGTASLKEKAGRLTHIDEWFPPEKSRFQVLTKALRVHQWAKNLLLFLPLILSHKLEAGSLWLAALGWAAFSLTASSVYLVNDLFDLHADRQHPTKKKRPLAAGTLQLHHGAAWALLCLALGISVSALAGLQAVKILGLYVVITSVYSFKLKKIALIDTITLAGLFTLRIVAGGIITSTAVSFWLMFFSIFFFLSLAFAKRASELITVKNLGKKKTAGRGYYTEDVLAVSQIGTSLGLCSIIILALYIHNPATALLYKSPTYLIFACSLILYWLLRVWLLTHRGEMHDDPVAFAMKDRQSYLVALGVIISAILAMFL